jgi:hypothetical protein
VGRVVLLAVGQRDHSLQIRPAGCALEDISAALTASSSAV